MYKKIRFCQDFVGILTFEIQQRKGRELLFKVNRMIMCCLRVGSKDLKMQVMAGLTACRNSFVPENRRVLWLSNKKMCGHKKETVSNRLRQSLRISTAI